MTIERIDYESYLRSLLAGRTKLTVENSAEEVLDTLAVMLNEEDPRFARSVAKNFTRIFRWGEGYIANEMVELVRANGDSRGIRGVSVEDAFELIYPAQTIHQIKKYSGSNTQKLFKNSQLFYLDQSALIDYLRKNSSTELIVRLNVPKFR